MHRSRQIDLIEAPSDLGLKPPAPGRVPGARRAPEALRAAGLHEMLALRSVRTVEPPHYHPDEARVINVRNMQAIADYSRTLAAEIGNVRQDNGFPLLIGGDCSVLLGARLALKRGGTSGLVFIDGHTDFFVPEQSGTGGAAGMDLALATGWGSQTLTNIDGMSPCFEPCNVLLLGNRDFERPPPGDIPTAAESGMDYWDLPSLRRKGTVETASTRLNALARRPVDGIWVHLDVDALDDAIMPAVDSRQPDGLSWEEMGAILGAAFATGKIAGMEITIFDPDLDSNGTIASDLVRNIVQWLEPLV